MCFDKFFGLLSRIRGFREAFWKALTGVFQAFQGKKNGLQFDGQKATPTERSAGASGTFFPPWPGYPLPGCSPAEPDSVSPGKMRCKRCVSPMPLPSGPPMEAAFFLPCHALKTHPVVLEITHKFC